MSRIEVRNLVKKWPGVKAVDRVSFTASQGSLTVLLGPSGCGKSTILRLIAGLEDVSAGEVLIGGRNVDSVDPADRGVSMVFQSYALFPHLSVRENILFGLKVRKVSRNDQEKRLQDAVAKVGLEELSERKPSQLSGGQRQRVALARTLVARQPVCLMDEPLSNLDAKLRAKMRDEIRDLQQQLGLTMLYVTHDQTEAMTMADRIILLRNGRIEQNGTPKDLYERPQSTFVARFIGLPPMNLLQIESSETALEFFGGNILADKLKNHEGWMIGIRPEDVIIGDQGIPARIESIDYLGSETLFRIQLSGQSLTARLQGKSSLVEGQAIAVCWKHENIHLFDNAGERRKLAH